MRSGIRDGLAIVICSAVAALVHPALAAGGQKPTDAAVQMPETVLVGCLKSHGADTAVAGPSGRLYTLDVSEEVPVKSTSTTGAGSPPLTATTTTYSLSNKSSVDLERHAGHQVQLTGRMQAPSTPAKDPSAPTGAPPSGGTPGGAHRTFEVSAVKMMEGKCS